MIEKRDAVPAAAHENFVADQTDRFINYMHGGPGGHFLRTVATHHFLEGFSRHFGRPVTVVLRVANLTGYGKDTKRDEGILTFEGVLKDADRSHMTVDVKSGNYKESLDKELKIEPREYNICYGLHQGEDEGQKTTIITIDSVIIDGEL